MEKVKEYEVNPKELILYDILVALRSRYVSFGNDIIDEKVNELIDFMDKDTSSNEYESYDIKDSKLIEKVTYQKFQK